MNNFFFAADIIYSFNNRLQGHNRWDLKEWMISEKENKKILFQILVVRTYATYVLRSWFFLL